MGEANRRIGKVLNDTYRLESLIGEGGMGAVYEASHLRLSRRFAVKLLTSSISESPEALARFGREAQITSAIGHPHIVEVTDFNYTQDGAPFIVMELLDGEDLSRCIRRSGPLPLPLVASIFKQASSALQAAHQMGVIHRDLKPQNIFLCHRGGSDHFVKVVDFGISKVVGSQSGLTKSHAILGTPFYMSPEQAEQDASSVDLRSDVYALAAIIHEMLTGQPPFSGDSVPALLYKVVHKDPPSIRETRPDVPKSMEQVINRAMRKAREKRFASMAQFWEAFEAAISKEGVEFTEPTEDRGHHWTGKHTAAPAAGAPGRVTTLGASIGEVLPRPRSRTRTLKIVASALFGLFALVAGITMFVLFSNNSRDPDRVAAVSYAPPDAAEDLLQAVRIAPLDTGPPPVKVEPTRPLWLASKPSDAAVFLKDKLLGTTPLLGVGVPTRELTLLLKKEGYKPRSVTVDRGRRTARLGSVTLEPVKPKIKRRRRGRRRPRAVPVPAAPVKAVETPKPPDKKKSTPKRKGWILEPSIE